MKRRAKARTCRAENVRLAMASARDLLTHDEAAEAFAHHARAAAAV